MSHAYSFFNNATESLYTTLTLYFIVTVYFTEFVLLYSKQKAKIGNGHGSDLHKVRNNVSEGKSKNDGEIRPGCSHSSYSNWTIITTLLFVAKLSKQKALGPNLMWRLQYSYKFKMPYKAETNPKNNIHTVR